MSHVSFHLSTMQSFPYVDPEALPDLLIGQRLNFFCATMMPWKSENRSEKPVVLFLLGPQGPWVTTLKWCTAQCDQRWCRQNLWQFAWSAYGQKNAKQQICLHYIVITCYNMLWLRRPASSIWTGWHQTISSLPRLWAAGLDIAAESRPAAASKRLHVPVTALCCAVLRFPCAKTLPVYFKLFRSQVLQLWLVPSHATRDFHSSDNVEDKALRKSIFNHIVRDIAHMNQKTKNQKDRSSWRGCARFSNTSASSIKHDIEVNYELRDFFFAHLKETDTEVCLDQCSKFGLPWNWDLLLYRPAQQPHGYWQVCRHACAVFITMWPSCFEVKFKGDIQATNKILGKPHRPFLSQLQTQVCHLLFFQMWVQASTDLPINPQRYRQNAAASEVWKNSAFGSRSQKNTQGVSNSLASVWPRPCIHHLSQSTSSFARKVQDLHCRLRSGQIHMWWTWWVCSFEQGHTPGCELNMYRMYRS